MGLSTLVQIPCHHMLANEISLNFKYRIGLKQIFNIILGICIKNYFFGSYFWHISLYFYSKFDQESSLDVKLNSASNEYPLGILLAGPATPKIRNTRKIWWWHHHYIFSGISCFWGSRVRQKYAEWVFVGCEI